MYKVEIHDDGEVTLVMDKEDLAFTVEAFKKLLSVRQNPASGFHADAMDLMLGFEDILKEMQGA